MTILTSNARFKVACCGRRFGKTQLFSHALVLGHGKFKGALQGKPVAYFSLTYKNVAEMWERLKQLLAPIIAYKNENDHFIKLITGGTIECWSMETAETVRGRAYAGVVIDEAAYVPKLLDIWEGDIRPMLLDFKGWALFGSTPNGFNDFHTLWTRGRDTEQSLWRSWQFPSSSNPHLPAEELREIEGSVPQRTWEQEYLAQFVEDGGVFRGVGAVTIAEPLEPYAGDFVMGVDWGRSHDYTVLSVIDAQSKRQVAVERFNQVSWELQRGRLRALYDDWKPRVIVAESNSIGAPNIEALQKEGLPVEPFETTATSKTPLIDALALAIERQEITLLTDPLQKAELQAFQIERLASGKYRYTAPSGAHDDMVMALALAWHGASLQATVSAVRVVTTLYERGNQARRRR